uniref:uncharacterized protein isoform X2 n=1 Tax=Pristiophorus japonicus TaxID=55135 RepID=UPI00398F0AA5
MMKSQAVEVMVFGNAAPKGPSSALSPPPTVESEEEDNSSEEVPLYEVALSPDPCALSTSVGPARHGVVTWCHTDHKPRYLIITASRCRPWRWSTLDPAIHQHRGGLIGITGLAAATGGADPRSDTEDDQPQAPHPSRDPSTSGHHLEKEAEEEEEEEEDKGEPNSAQHPTTPAPPPALSSSGDDMTFSGFEDCEAPGTSGVQQRSAGVESRGPTLQRMPIWNPISGGDIPEKHGKLTEVGPAHRGLLGRHLSHRSEHSRAPAAPGGGS